jgi:type IV pilus assembly protein PilA
MLNKLRVRAQNESGFTLVELLVVMLILGLLAAIAVPAFFNQRDKANDAKAKTVAKTAQTAIETYATDHNGVYTSADVAALRAIEPTLPSTGFTVTVGGPKAYTIVATATNTGHTFTIDRDATGLVTYPCTTAGTGGCPSGTAGWGG